MISSRKVAISIAERPWEYPESRPFLPDTEYPEFNGRVNVGHERNITYSTCRDVLNHLGLDNENFGTVNWNPLKEIIKPGDKVVIKPNLVRHLHLGGGEYCAVVTHASLVRCLLDFVALALRGKGKVTVGDAPIQSTDFPIMLQRTGLDEVCKDISKSWEIPVSLVDFRLWSIKLNDRHQVVESNSLQGDPSGYLAVDLGKHSALNQLGCDGSKYRITNYDSGELQSHHNQKKNEYLIPKTILEADVVINIPKLKTHRKVGMTASLKNLVGINGHKDWLPHHREGSIPEGGDEYKNAFILKRLHTKITSQIDQYPYSKLNYARDFISRFIYKLNKFTAPDPYYEGSWYGNDTLWRTVLDLNRLLYYSDSEGRLHTTIQRKCLTIVDGIIAGEGEGPMEPDAKPCGIIVGGQNPVAVDAVLSTIIGFDFQKMPLILNGFKQNVYPLTDFDHDDINVSSNNHYWDELIVGKGKKSLKFKPASGWLGNIELK